MRPFARGSPRSYNSNASCSGEGGLANRGSSALRHLLASRPRDARASESVLEARLLRLLEDHGLPPPVRQYDVVVEGRLVARVDFAWPQARLALEADGYRWHSSRQAWQRDLRRRNALTAAGWEVLHATWSDLGTDGLQILAEVGARLGVQFPGGSGSTIGYGTASPRAAGARAGPW